MIDSLRTTLHDFTLTARAELSEEAQALLTGVYGVRPDGTLEPVRDLPAVQASAEAQDTRQRIERHLQDEMAAGYTGPEAVLRLARETAFTHVNRLVAFKLLEARKLMYGTIDRHHESNGFKRYLVAHDDDLARYEAGDLPRDGLGEGPRDVAYRHFVLWQCAELSRELRVLFDPDVLPSRLFPRPRALKSVIDALNNPALAEAWRAGNEETLGWVYQSFNAEELEAAFRDVRLTGKKFEKQDIPAVTQLFTPRWIVQWLVHNTLGRLWMELHPDSGLSDQLSYLVPTPHPATPQPPRLAREITLLDPACGTMHFGLVAFDVFAAMYREEIERAGESGWPATPSVASAVEIPAAIVAHNLHGIDIDLRAVQLSALALFVKAKTLNPKAQLTHNNLACADVSLLSDDRLNTFLAEAKFTRPVYERVIRALWPRLKDAAQFGSLLRIEAEIRELVARERSRHAHEADLFNQEQFSDVADGPEDFWELLDAQIVQAFDAFARQHAAGEGERFFAGEAVKGFRLLDVLQRRYDVVVTNPPYLSQRKVNAKLKDFLAEQYPAGKLDTYAAFIERCLELVNVHGRVGMLTMHSFMFISSYEKLRQLIRSSARIENVLHLGPRLFAVGNPGTLQTVAFTLAADDAAAIENATATYFRLVKEPNAEAKRAGFEQALAQWRIVDRHAEGLTRSIPVTLADGDVGGDSGAPALDTQQSSEAQGMLRSAQHDSRVYTYRQADFDAIPGGPWVYWITQGLRQLFANSIKIGEVATPKVGLQTGENLRFLRFWWELRQTSVKRNVLNPSRIKNSQYAWIPYMKGGESIRWYGNQEHVVNWKYDGTEIRAFVPTAVIRNPTFYFRRGVTWTDLTQGRFSARLSPGGFIFDVAGSSAFPPEDKLYLTLGLMNSRVAQFALKLLNPTMHVQVGDLSRLPIPTQTSEHINTLVEQAIALARQDSAESETTYDFIAPPAWPGGLDEVAARHAQLAQIEHDIDDEVYRLYGISPADRAAIEAELAAPTALLGEGEEAAAEPDDEATAALEPADNTTLAQAWVSYAVGVVLGRFQPGETGNALGAGSFSPEAAQRLRQLADADGITILEAGHPDDLTAKVRRALEIIVGDDEAETLIETATGGKALADWLAKDFFKLHAQHYRKRPIYWPLQSPRRTYSALAFHERLTRDSLPLLAGNRYARGRLNTLDREIEHSAAQAASAAGRDKRKAEQQLASLRDERADVEAFIQRLEATINLTNPHGETVGWQPELDDGVLINLAPLRELLPAWSAEPKKAWDALAKGDYDWSHTAMRYWPERVREKCKTNKSYAIAHGFA